MKATKPGRGAGLETDQEIEHLSGKHKALSSNFSTTKKKK
jgi:hypothetical protein